MIIKNTRLSPEAALDLERSAMSCTPAQGMLALGEGEWSKVVTLKDSHATPFAMRVAIENTTLWQRNSQMMDELAWLMGYTAEQVDDLFRLAASIKV
jgi:hypothetical protein